MPEDNANTERAVAELETLIKEAEQTADADMGSAVGEMTWARGASIGTVIRHLPKLLCIAKAVRKFLKSEKTKEDIRQLIKGVLACF